MLTPHAQVSLVLQPLCLCQGQRLTAVCLCMRQIPQDSLGKAYENSVPESLIPCNFPAYDFIYTNVTEAFYATLGACIAFSVLFCLPFLVYQSWCFLIPSRYHRERIAYRKLSFWVFTYTMRDSMLAGWRMHKAVIAASQ